MTEQRERGAAEPIAIAGAGRVAQALGRLLRERGQPVTAVASRDPSHARAAAKFIGDGVASVTYAELPGHAASVVIAVSDDALTQVAAALAASGMTKGVALHTCGASGPDALAPLQARGVSCGTLHPLQSVFSPEQGARDLVGATFAISGNGAAAQLAERIVALAGGRTLRISDEKRPLYHAAAAMASNYVVTLIAAALHTLQAAGVSQGAALAALDPLIRASVAYALSGGPLDTMTGPISRGDAQTVASHLRALASMPETIRELYRSAGLETLRLARVRGLSEEKARELEALLRK